MQAHINLSSTTRQFTFIVRQVLIERFMLFDDCARIARFGKERCLNDLYQGRVVGASLIIDKAVKSEYSSLDRLKGQSPQSISRYFFIIRGYVFMGVAQIKRELASMADGEQAAQLQRIFKTGPGAYGQGDVFLGIRMPQLRKLVRRHLDLDLNEVGRLLHSEIHEHRMAALLILTYQFPRAGAKQQASIYRFYLDNSAWIDNWDLVDVTVTHIVGAYLLSRSRRPLYRLAASSNMWERRIAMVATLAFIRRDQFEDTLNIADILLSDDQDSIHKASGWMLREVGNRDLPRLEDFLHTRYRHMPRTMLRYAIEKMPESRRQAYLKGNI